MAVLGLCAGVAPAAAHAAPERSVPAPAAAAEPPRTAAAPATGPQAAPHPTRDHGPSPSPRGQGPAAPDEAGRSIPGSEVAQLARAVYVFPALFVVVFAPGWLLVRRRLPAGTSALERWALYAGLGVAGVSIAGGFLYALPLAALGIPPRVVPPVAAALVALGAWAAGRARPASPVPRATRGELVFAGFAALTFLLFFLGLEDAAQYDSCLFRGLDALYRVRPYPRDGGPAYAPLFDIPAHSRVGNPLAVAIPHALHGPAGRRLTSGLFAVLLLLGTAALGRRVTGRAWPGMVAAVLLVGSEDVFGSDVVNQNMYAAAHGALLLLLLQPAWRGRTGLRALAAAALFGSRHVALVGLAALVFVEARECGAGWLSAAARRRLLRLGGLFLAFTLPVWAVMAYERVTRGELQISDSFLNFPFYERLVRVPFLPLPGPLAWPVHWVIQWGILVAGAIAVGLWQLWRDRRADGTRAIWPLYGLPIFAALALQANWFEPDKMTIGLLLAPVLATGLAAFLARCAGGLRPALRQLGRGALAAAVIAVLRPLVFLVPADPDPRLLESMRALRSPSDDPLVAFERERWSDWPLLPGPRGAGVLTRLPRKLVAADRALREPLDGPTGHSERVWSLRWRMHALLSEVEPESVRAARANGARPVVPADARLLALDLRETPALAAQPLRELPSLPADAPVLSVSRRRECALTPEQYRIAPWDQPCRVAVCLSDTGAAWVFVSPPARPTRPGEPDHGRQSFHDREVDPAELARLPRLETVALAVPPAVERVHLVEVLYLGPDRVYRRLAERGPDGVWQAGAPWLWRHN